MPVVGKDNVPVIYLEIVDQGSSGFYLDNTEGTPHEHQLHTPTVSWIPTDGIMVEEDAKGVKTHKRIRHIKGCHTLDPLEQDKTGWKPNRNADKIPMDNGFASIRRDGSTVLTYDYLTLATYFADNPLRPATATPLYREIKVDERAVQLLDEDELETAAKAKVYSLRLSVGGGKYKYDEDKINSYCRLLNVWDETSERKLILLIDIAKRHPKEFLDIIVKAEQTVITEVSHALQLGVIIFEGNTPQYAKESKVIGGSLGAGKMSEIKKVEALASYLQTPEGNNDLTELRTKLELEKELQFKA